uniref:Conserved oligomeric Golgi complex subunit 2 n=1 Tax=Globodera rostochiensis TaxID=31243 RepID=A0A914GWV4_GLORO
MPDPGCDDSPQLQLCFNRAHFQRSDFNVERFVNLTRKRATLDQLQNDLRIYLRYLQNSMIELINDDYADFVNLSSGLAALRESVDKVSSDVQSNWSSFATSIAEIKNCSDAIEQNLADLIRCQKLQISQGDKLALFQSIQILCEFVDRIDDKGSFCWYSKLALLISAVELWLARTQNVEVLPPILKSKDECYKKISEILLGALENEMFGHSKASGNLSIFITLIRITHSTEMAICRIVNGLVEKKIVRLNVEQGKRLDDLLENALNQTLELRKGWAESAKRNRQFTLEVVIFIDTCLLNFIGSFLEEDFVRVYNFLKQQIGYVLQD